MSEDAVTKNSAANTDAGIEQPVWWRRLPFFASRNKSLHTLQILSLIGLVVATILPGDGLGISICMMQNMTGLPCPGCGLTRSVVHTLHLNLERAFFYNPFGIPVAFGMVYFALSSVLPPLASLYEKTEKWFYRFLNVFIIGLFVAGTIRLVGLLYFPEISHRFAIVMMEKTVVPGAIETILLFFK